MCDFLKQRLITFFRGTRKYTVAGCHFEPHHTDLLSLEQTLIQGLSEHLIHNSRIPHNVLMTHFRGEKQDSVPEPEEFRDGTMSFVIPKKISLSSNETVH